jgi:hypothetical protein
MSSNLQQLQHELQRSILAATDTSLVLGADQRDRSARLGIYAYAYRARLQDALADNYPALQAHLGTEEFATIARSYIAAQPSRHFSIRTFGSHLPTWLAAARPSEPWLRELAAFEWTLGCAFDAPDEAPLPPDALSSLPAEDWPALTFRFATCAMHLSLQTNAPHLYECAMRGQAAVGRRETAPAEYLIWRQSLSTHYRPLSGPEAAALTALRAGQTFAAACGRLLEHCPADEVPLRAAACLKRWLADGIIVEFASATVEDGERPMPQSTSSASPSSFN